MVVVAEVAAEVQVVALAVEVEEMAVVVAFEEVVDEEEDETDQTIGRRTGTCTTILPAGIHPIHTTTDTTMTTTAGAPLHTPTLRTPGTTHTPRTGPGAAAPLPEDHSPHPATGDVEIRPLQHPGITMTTHLKDPTRLGVAILLHREPVTVLRPAVARPVTSLRIKSEKT